MLLILKRLWITVVIVQLNEQHYAEYLWNSNFSLNITTSTLFFRPTNWVICKKNLRLVLKPKIMSFHLLNGSVNDGTFKKREKMVCVIWFVQRQDCRVYSETLESTVWVFVCPWLSAIWLNSIYCLYAVGSIGTKSITFHLLRSP